MHVRPITLDEERHRRWQVETEVWMVLELIAPHPHHLQGTNNNTCHTQMFTFAYFLWKKNWLSFCITRMTSVQRCYWLTAFSHEPALTDNWTRLTSKSNINHNKEKLSVGLNNVLLFSVQHLSEYKNYLHYFTLPLTHYTTNKNCHFVPLIVIEV